MSVDRRLSTWRWEAMGVTLLASAPVTACTETATGPDLWNAVVVGGVTYHVKSFAIAESFPVQVGVTVELRNDSGAAQSVTFPDGCVVLMRAYDGQDNLAWDFGHLVDCTLALVEVDLSPGEREEFDTGLISAATILGEDLPDGEYRIAVYLRPNGRTVELDAGMADLAVPRN